MTNHNDLNRRIETAIWELMLTDGVNGTSYMFFTMIMQRVNRTFSDRVPTMGVRLDGTRFEMTINPEFASSLNDNELMGVLLHEILHLAYGHPFWGPSYLPHKEVANIAFDLFVNQFIPKNFLPQGALFPELFGLPANKDSVWYYDELMKNAQSSTLQKVCNNMNGEGEEQNGPGSGTKHNWEVGNTPEERESGQILQEEMVANVASECERNRGTVPSGIQSLIDARKKIKPPIENWRMIFRRFYGSTIDSDIRNTRMTPSRRFEDAPGRRFRFKAKVLVGIDTSGSVSNDEIATFFSEITNIWKNGAIVDIAECDAQVHETYKFTGKIPESVSGRGGTSMQPIFDYAKNRDYNLVIMMTDGFVESEIKTYKFPSIWCITKGGSTAFDIKGPFHKKIQFSD